MTEYDVISQEEEDAMIIVHNFAPLDKDEAEKLAKEAEKHGHQRVRLRETEFAREYESFIEGD